MTTAVIYSGEARTFAQTFPNQWFHVLRKLENPVFFVSVADDPQADDMLRLLERFPENRVHFEKVQQPTLPEPAPDPQWLAMYPPSATPQAILRQLWALERAWKFAVLTSNEKKLDAPMAIIRLRPDLAFARFEMPKIGMAWTCYTPWWARWGGVNDRVAVMDYEAACAYFNTYSCVKGLMERGCPLHPETLIHESLKRSGVADGLHQLATEFSTIRLDGTVVPPSITTIDSIEYARTQP